MEILFEFSALSWWVIGLLIFAGFVAGYIDAIAGGGGMVQTLALLAAGIPPFTTLATNKVVSMSGTVAAVIKYAQSKVINARLVMACLLPCLIASAIGSSLVMKLSEKTVTLLIILCIPIAFAVMFLRTKPTLADDKPASAKKAIALLSPIAFYDGLLGPGTGTYMAIAGNKGLGLSFLHATGLAKPLNLATNVGSAVVYIFAGQVLWQLALPMAAASVFGAYLGSRSAVARGDSFIRNIMISMLVVMLVINVAQLFQ